MLKATSVQVLLTAADIQGVLEEYSAGRVAELRVAIAEGEVVLSLKLNANPLPFPMPVELHFAMRSVQGTAVELGVRWANLPLLPAALKEMALKQAFEALPGSYSDGVLRLDVAEFVEHVPVTFGIDGIDLRQDMVRIALRDLIVFPVEIGSLVTAQSGELVPVPSAQAQDVPEHSSYYQRLRETVSKFADDRAPRWARPLLPWLLAAPDFFVLMLRLARDERVPATAKILAGISVAYFVSPVDLIPDPLPLVGSLDDLTLALFALDQLAQRLSTELVEEHWPGEGKVMDLVKAGTGLFSKALPAKLLVAIKRLIRE